MKCSKETHPIWLRQAGEFLMTVIVVVVVDNFSWKSSAISFGLTDYDLNLPLKKGKLNYPGNYIE